MKNGMMMMNMVGIKQKMKIVTCVYVSSKMKIFF